MWSLDGDQYERLEQAVMAAARKYPGCSMTVASISPLEIMIDGSPGITKQRRTHDHRGALREADPALLPGAG
jgi:hypothetical protein